MKTNPDRLFIHQKLKKTYSSIFLIISFVVFGCNNNGSYNQGALEQPIPQSVALDMIGPDANDAIENKNSSNTTSFERLNQVIERSLSLMSLDQRLSQLLIIQMRYDSQGRPIRSLDENTKTLLRELAPGGLILFGENVQHPEQLLSFIFDVHHAVPGPPPILAIDQEGGLVNRLRSPAMGATPLPSAFTMAQRGTQFTERAGYVTAKELRVLGITMNFAPVADLSGNPETAFISTRSFGPDPNTTGKLVSSFIQGQNRGGVASVIKHFPGHGATEVDSHFAVVTFPYTTDELGKRDLIPFQEGINAGAAGVMAAHIQYPNIDASLFPASISPILLQDLLRETLGFTGLIITDALEMQGVKQIMSSDQAAVQAILAGADMILTPNNPWPTLRALLSAVENGLLSEERINQSVRRILQHKALWGSGLSLQGRDYQIEQAQKILGSQEHRRLMMLE